MPFDQANYEPADSILRNLITARAAIANESAWCVGDRLNQRGQRCALGALDAAFGRYCGAVDQPEVELLARFSVYPLGSLHPRWGKIYHPAMQVAQHNNEMGHAATLEMFDRAIAARKAELLMPNEVGAVAVIRA